MGFVFPLLFSAFSYANYQYLRNIPMFDEYQLFAIVGPWAYTLFWFMFSRLWKRGKFFRFMMWQGTIFVFIPVLTSWGLLGTYAYFIYSKPELFEYTWQPMKVARYFVVIVPEKLPRANYIAFKVTVTSMYCLSMTYVYVRGWKAAWAWYRIAKDKAIRDPYSRPTNAEIERWDYIDDPFALL